MSKEAGMVKNETAALAIAVVIVFGGAAVSITAFYWLAVLVLESMGR